MYTKAKTRLMLIWLILAFVLLCSISITMIFANTSQTALKVGISYSKSEEYNSDNLIYNKMSNGEYEVLINENMSGNIIIPKYYTDSDGNKCLITTVESIWSGTTCDSFQNVKTIVISDSISNIKSMPFWGCSDLENIIVKEGNPKYHSSGNCVIETDTKKLVAGCKNSVIPDDGSVTTIGEYAFAGKNLTSLTIPSSVTSIGLNPFLFCPSKPTITVDSDNPKYKSDSNCIIEKETNTLVLGWCIANGDHMLPSVEIIGERSFYNSRIVGPIHLSTSTTTIKSYAFEECISLKKVYGKYTDNKLKLIEPYAFKSCSALTSVELSGTWHITSSSTYDSSYRYDGQVDINASSLSASTVATYLTSTYADKYWHKG